MKYFLLQVSYNSRADIQTMQHREHQTMLVEANTLEEAKEKAKDKIGRKSQYIEREFFIVDLTVR